MKAIKTRWRKTEWGWNANHGRFCLQVFNDDKQLPWRAYFDGIGIKDGSPPTNIDPRDAKTKAMAWLRGFIAAAKAVK